VGLPVKEKLIIIMGKLKYFTSKRSTFIRKRVSDHDFPAHPYYIGRQINMIVIK